MNALERTWHCSFVNFKPLVDTKYAVLVLNCNLGERFSKIWNGADLRIAADGGGNRIFDRIQQENQKYLPPHLLKGDFDSLRSDVSSYFKEQGTEIIQDHDQNTTDFQKCLNVFQNTDFTHPILVCGGMGGSLTHTISNINTVFQFTKILKNQIYLISDENIGCVLQPGTHTIYGDTDMYCGFIPIGRPVIVDASENLKYPLDGLKMEAGSMISTSNQFMTEQVKVYTPEALLFLADSRTS